MDFPEEKSAPPDTKDVEHVIASLQQIIKHEDVRADVVANKQLRNRLAEACRHTMLRLEQPWDSIRRYNYAVFDVAIAKTGHSMGLWAALVAQSPKPVHATQLAETTGVQFALLMRLLRYATAQSMVEQTDVLSFRAIEATRTLSMPLMKSSFAVATEILFPSALAMDAYFKSSGSEEPTDRGNTLFQQAFNTSQHCFEWLSAKPDLGQDFFNLMIVRRAGLKTWLEGFAVEKYIDVNDNTDRIQFVDVGGGTGQQALAVLQKHPEIAGKVVVQETPSLGALKLLQKDPQGLTPMAADFFQPNPLKGAKAYYMRNILHDWPDAECRVILGHLRDVLEEDSVILLDDLVVDDMEMHWHPSATDLTMMTLLAAKERSLAEWSALIESVGLERRENVAYDSYGLNIQVLGRKS
ncbi:related to O-methyltransferase [Ramularia collo-cygni]|uniref:Related to O-methyltransferase n=1 Tax=Ramularia collo-cygni TaxID=112498 RepID=A0A2D3VI61_9PEZI|nr:related to O-methyltransferase [Ramularia collo-cygni]CZT25860.1 related to O-methyltransferase [Ramularia collo-cygni]